MPNHASRFTIVSQGTTPTTPFRFEFQDADLMTQVREEFANTVTITANWFQGSPAIPNFSKSSIRILFFSSNDSSTPLTSSDAMWRIGTDDADSDPQALDTIVTLGAFTDNGNGTGTIEVNFITRYVDLMRAHDIYFELAVNQPAV